MPTLNWIGKEAVVEHHRRVPTRLLECDRELSVGDPEAENLLVEGDNLEALKALLPRYRGQVKCIYIDPPYNTGNESWVYNDNVNDPRIRKWLGEVVGKEAEDLCRHDKWLCMMYPRLALLREFLREDGIIFISIDDNEIVSLRAVMNEIFGPDNFVANIIWQKRTSPDMRLQFSTAHDYILVFAKRACCAKFHRLPKSAKQTAQYRNPDNDPRGRWVSSDYTAQGFRPNQMYEITTPGGAKYRPPQGVCWKNIEPVFLALVAENRIWFGKDGMAMPRRKTFLSDTEGNAAWTWWPNEEVGHTQEAKKELDTILGAEHWFDTPKPTRLLERILALSCDRDSLVLDSFVGSGTTGDAVLQLNRRDGGSRRFIAVELDPSICTRVTAERLRRVIDRQVSETGEGTWSRQAASGFRYCRLGRTLLDANGNINGEVPFADLARYVYLLATGVPAPKQPRKDCPLLGVHHGTAIYLLYNGVLGDRRPAGGNVLTSAVLAALPPHPAGRGPRIVYGEASRLGENSLRREDVTFRQVPILSRQGDAEGEPRYNRSTSDIEQGSEHDDGPCHL